jgi:hypothetical protein
VKRESQRYWSSALHGLLGHAVSYDCVRGQFFFMHRTLRDFYYLMFQRKVMAIRHTLRLPVPVSETGDFFGPILADQLDSAELLVYAHDVAERLEAYRQYVAAQEARRAAEREAAEAQCLKRPSDAPLQDERGGKKFKASSALSRPRAVAMEAAEDAEEECHFPPVKGARKGESDRTEKTLQRYVKENGDVLAKFAKFPFKRYHGVPTGEAMLLRLYDIELFMTYCRDGWRMGSWASQMLTQRSALDDTLSVWPYCERVVTDPEERARALNSAYYVKRYNPASADWYDLVEISKTTKVIHRRYCEPTW